MTIRTEGVYARFFEYDSTMRLIWPRPGCENPPDGFTVALVEGGVVYYANVPFKLVFADSWEFSDPKPDPRTDVWPRPSNWAPNPWWEDWHNAHE